MRAPKVRVSLTVFALVAGCVLFVHPFIHPLWAPAEPLQQAGEVVRLGGNRLLLETVLIGATQGDTQELEVNDPVRTGTRLETDEKSTATLLINGETTALQLGASTVIEDQVRKPPGVPGPETPGPRVPPEPESREVRPPPDTEPEAEEGPEAGFWGWIRQTAGKIRVFLTDPSRGLSVVTEQGHIAARSTAFIVEVDPSRPGAPGKWTRIWALEGEVEVLSLAGGDPVVLQAGEMTVIRAGRQPTPPTPFDPESGATGSGAVPPDFDPPDDPLGPLLFPRPDELPPRRGIDQPGLPGGG